MKGYTFTYCCSDECGPWVDHSAITLPLKHSRMREVRKILWHFHTDLIYQHDTSSPFSPLKNLCIHLQRILFYSWYHEITGRCGTTDTLCPMIWTKSHHAGWSCDWVISVFSLGSWSLLSHYLTAIDGRFLCLFSACSPSAHRESCCIPRFKKRLKSDRLLLLNIDAVIKRCLNCRRVWLDNSATGRCGWSSWNSLHVELGFNTVKMAFVNAVTYTCDTSRAL